MPVKLPMRRLMAVGIEQDEAGLRAGDADLDPALLLAKRLVGEDDEAQLLGVEIERGVLIADRNRCEFDGFDHGRKYAENC